MTRQLFFGLALAGSATAEPAEVARLLTAGAVTMALVAKTGTLVAAVCEDQKLRFWSLPEGRLWREINLGERSLDAAVLSSDARRIAVGDHNGSYTVWDVSTGAEQLQVRIPYYPFGLAFSPDGKRVAIAPAGEPVQIYDLETRTRLFELQRVVGGTAAVAFASDSGQIGTADADTSIRIYNAQNGELLARNTDFLLVPLAAAFTPDGKRLLAGGADKVIATLDSSTGSAVRHSVKLADPVAYLEVSPDGTKLVCSLMHANNMLMPAPVLITETESGRRLHEWLPQRRVLGGGWINNGHLLMAIGGDKALQIWRLQ